MTVILNPPSKAIAAVGTSPKANTHVLRICVNYAVCMRMRMNMCMCMYVHMYKSMSMRICTRYGLNDRDSESTMKSHCSRWDKPESQ